VGLNYKKKLKIELKQIGLGSSSGLGPTKEMRFTIVGGINDTPININLPGSHRCYSIRVSCLRLPHEGPSSPTTATTHNVIINMVTFPIELTEMDDNEYEVLLINPKRTFKSPTKATIENSADEKYANYPKPPKNKTMVCLNRDTYELYLLIILLMFFEANSYMYIK
jgi:hypothetical protein